MLKQNVVALKNMIQVKRYKMRLAGVRAQTSAGIAPGEAPQQRVLRRSAVNDNGRRTNTIA
ncbi:MAG: hypothetical protein KDI13_04445 [Alphaproteobacteria bacterium]|nr:hypothetical protein [Alphaproteobacteria bacterium]